MAMDRPSHAETTSLNPLELLVAGRRDRVPAGSRPVLQRGLLARQPDGAVHVPVDQGLGSPEGGRIGGDLDPTRARASVRAAHPRQGPEARWPRWRVLTRSKDLYIAGRVLATYLPETIATYLALPAEWSNQAFPPTAGPGSRCCTTS